jgi:hypothetical protein
MPAIKLNKMNVLEIVKSFYGLQHKIRTIGI